MTTDIVHLTYLGVCLEVIGEYVPKEPGWFSNKEGVGNPEIPAYFNLSSVFCNGQNLTEMLECLVTVTGESVISDIEQLAVKYMEDSP